MSSDDTNSEVLRRLAMIEAQVTSLDETSAFALRANRDEHMQTVRSIFGKSKLRAKVYLAANGKRRVQDIADLLNITKQAVSPHLLHLAEQGLLAPLPNGKEVYYAKKRLDRTLGISKYLRDEFKLTDPL